MEAISTTQQQQQINSVPRSKIPTHMEETMKKKKNHTLNKTTTSYSFVPKIHRREK